MNLVRSWTTPALVLLSSLALADGGAQHQVKQSTPVKMGTSGGSLNDISRFYCCSGTLGALVTRDGVVCILSNNHVLARSGTAVAGEDTLQPGLIDSNCSGVSSNVIGDFAGNLVPLGTANVDTGLSIARAGMVDTSGAILDIGVPSSTTAVGTVGMAVQKSGRTTGYTTGNITATNASVTIQYQRGCNTGKKFNISFTNQLVTGAMSAGGDSGSVLFDMSKHPVGLLFAGSASTTIYNKIQDVVSAYSAGGHTFSFVGSALTVTGPLQKRNLAPSDEDLALALQIKVENEGELMKMPGVFGVGIGAAEDNPVEAVIVVLFDRGQVLNLPERIEGYRVRVIITDPIVAQ